MPEGVSAWRSPALFLHQRIALLDQLVKLFSLLRDTIRVALLILGPRKRRGLLDQLPDIVAHNGDAIFEFGERKRDYRWSLCFSLVDG